MLAWVLPDGVGIVCAGIDISFRAVGCTVLRIGNLFYADFRFENYVSYCVRPLLAVCHEEALAPEEGGDPLVGRTAEWQVAQRALRSGAPT